MVITIDNLIRKHQTGFFPVVKFNPITDRLKPMDFTQNNTELTEAILNNTDKFSILILMKN
jgi:hypothetical protein